MRCQNCAGSRIVADDKTEYATMPCERCKGKGVEPVVEESAEQKKITELEKKIEELHKENEELRKENQRAF